MPCGVAAAIAVLLSSGCGEHPASSTQPTHVEDTKPDPAVKALEAQVGMVFPANTVLLSADDGGGRDASHGFYQWALFSPVPLKMPSMQATGVKDYLNLPLDDTVKFVQSRMPKRKIDQPLVALSSSWQMNGFAFGGTLIRTPKGDYLVIQRGMSK